MVRTTTTMVMIAMALAWLSCTGAPAPELPRYPGPPGDDTFTPLPLQPLTCDSGIADATAFGATGDDMTDDTRALQAAIDSGLPVYVPAGTYIVSRPLRHVTSSAATLTGGPRLRGAGPYATIFDNRVANGPMMQLDTSASDRFQSGGTLRDFAIVNTQSPPSSDGIAVRKSFHLLIENVRIQGLTGRGVAILVDQGDPDGSVMVKLSRMWISGCARWGIDASVAEDHNELSFLKLDHVFVASCGTAAGGAPPRSGGMRWKGQGLQLDSSAFVTNENVGLFVYGGAGSSQHLRAQGTTWENNRGVGLRIETLDNGLLENSQFFNNDDFRATHAVVIDPTNGAVSNLVFSGTVVRATAGNSPFIAFSITNTNAQYTVIERTSWQNFDHRGQTRFADAGHLTRIIDEGLAYPFPSPVRNVTLNAPGSYTPDMNRWKIHRLELKAPGAYVVNTPTTGGSATGKEMVLDIYNNSGSEVTVSFGGLLFARGFTAPPYGEHRVALFYYNSLEGWIQSSGWSP